MSHHSKKELRMKCDSKKERKQTNKTLKSGLHIAQVVSNSLCSQGRP